MRKKTMSEIEGLMNKWHREINNDLARRTNIDVGKLISGPYFTSRYEDYTTVKDVIKLILDHLNLEIVPGGTTPVRLEKKKSLKSCKDSKGGNE